MDRELRPFLVFAFDSTHVALDAEDALKRAGLSVVPIPTPAVLGELCGLAMRVPPDQGRKARSALADAGICARAETVIEDL